MNDKHEFISYIERQVVNKASKKEDTPSLDDNACVAINVGTNRNNVVDEDTLRRVQATTLEEAKKYLSRTFGPMGSNTKIITGNNKESIQSFYSKDGLKVLKSLANSGPIESSILEELIEITRHVEHEVGDGTTSTVILSSLIFDRLLEIKKFYKIPPYTLMRMFKAEVEKIKNIILEHKKECTVDDIYDISMISTNGNAEIAEKIRSIYEEYGMDVDLSVGISNGVDDIIKVYDGLTITEGMSDPVFINNKPMGTAEIHNARVYHFCDPIDDANQVALFEAILAHNIYEPLKNDEDCIPTVITCPRISKDLSSILRMLTNQLYQYNSQGLDSAKPPIVIITNVVASDELIMNDIADLCGCKDIKKYIDPNLYQRDVESGAAATPENVAEEFYGEAELVVADSRKTKFINPTHMTAGDEDPMYTSMVNHLKTEIENADDSTNVGLLKKRLSALTANMVEYLVGGVTISERDAIKDLVEDAIKNCSSAAKYGVGYAANFEALRASALNLYDQKGLSIEHDIVSCIFNAYFDIAKVLYSTVCSDQTVVDAAIFSSLDEDMPFDIGDGILHDKPSAKVKCAIQLDINILDTLAKIITMMVTCNQILLQAPQLNTY